MADPTVRGRFVWHELMTTDTKSAAGFFTKVIGWKTQGWDQDPSYTMFTSGGRPTAGLHDTASRREGDGCAPGTGSPTSARLTSTRPHNRPESLGGKILREPNDIPKSDDGH